MGEFPTQLHVYVVEDSPILVRMLASTIEAAGAELVGHSDSTHQAISEIFALQPDLILIDISLNRGNGFDVLRLLRHRGVAQSATKAVLTNHANPEYKALSFRLGAHQFYDKSFEMLKVVELIRMMAIGRAENGAFRPPVIQKAIAAIEIGVADPSDVPISSPPHTK
jgi:DNA-binding NarL/FixJ family response regulator